MNAWVLLAISIISEVCGTSALKMSDGFTKPTPTIVGIIAFSIALYLVSIVFRTLPVGLVYAVWSGSGIVLTALVAFFVFGQRPDLFGLLGMAMILAGVLIINLFSNTSAH